MKPEIDILKNECIFFGNFVITICDLKCEKAWGMNNRPRIWLDDNDADDYVYLSDDELGRAPDDPCWYEGGDAKPYKPRYHNKWCVRECERCQMFDPGQEQSIFDFSTRIYNMPEKHNVENVKIELLNGE